MIVKITILLIVVTLIYRFWIITYLKGNPLENLLLNVSKEFNPWYVYVGGILVFLDLAGILASTIYLLFFV